MPPPAKPKIYHIVHVDRLASIIAQGGLWCDSEARRQELPGTVIGIDEIKQRRLTNPFASRPGLRVGDCVPFYFCPRSVMLYVIYKASHSALAYRGGQDAIIHLEADLHETVEWAGQNGHLWAFTLSSAASLYFEDRCDLNQLEEIDWGAVRARWWSGPGIRSSLKEGKQAEFLIERYIPWTLTRGIGVRSTSVLEQVREALSSADHKPDARVRSDWYY